MRLNPEARLRKVGKEHFIIAATEDRIDLTYVYKLNETAAWIWRKCGEGEFTAEGLAERLSEEYEVDKETAFADVTAQLEGWREAGFIL